MDDKQKLIFEAIDNYELYAKSQRDILKLIINLAINDIAVVSVKYVVERTNVARSSVYNIMKNLQNDDVITKFRLKNTRQDSYKINRKKLDYIVQVYSNKKSVDRT